MQGKQRSNLAVGLILILMGALFLAYQLVPGAENWFGLFDWPIYIVGVALLLAVIGIIGGAPGMAVPVCVVGGIAGILYWQNITGNWDSWSYVWALIPGFVGLGIIISGLLGSKGNRWETVKGGLWLLVISGVLFVVFGSFFGLPLLGDYWPVLLILLGVLLLGRAVIRGR